MSQVIAALDASPALSHVAHAARAVANRLGADVAGVHVVEPKSPSLEELGTRAGFPVSALHGEPAEALLERIESPEVDLVVLGARPPRDDQVALGHVALDVATRTTRPLLVVPAHDRFGRDGSVSRVMLPLGARAGTTAVARRLVERLADGGAQVVIAHVSDHPAPGGSPTGDGEGWHDQFLDRHGWGGRRLEVRRGSPWEDLARLAFDIDADLVAVNWSQQLAPGRARIVQHLLTRPSIPVLLLPAGPIRRSRVDATV